MAYSGAGLYAWRIIEDRRRLGLPAFARTLHLKLTGAMLLVLVLDGAGYVLAVGSVSADHKALMAALEDIFVVVALLTVSVGLILPGMIAHAATEVSNAAKQLTSGTLRDFSQAMAALGRGDLESAHASVSLTPVRIHSHDELGELAASFNLLQQEVAQAAHGLDKARDSLHAARSELTASYQNTVRLAHHDALTDLPNRIAFTEHLAEVHARASADGTSFAVLCVDLDTFKEVNDVFGHAIGDDLLCAVSRRLETAAEGAFLARIGGDEFTLISTRTEPVRAVSDLAERLLATVEDVFDIRGQRLRIGLSIGIALFPKDGREAGALLSNADAALYRAKADGRLDVRFFEPEMDRHLQERHALQLDLRSALARDELFLHYQPQARSDETVFGFEALVRWQHPKLGLIGPQAFIPLAEQNGLIVSIGEWVLRSACREAASWSSPLKIAINLSPIQFQHGDLVGLVHSILFDSGLAPARLELEITEGVLIKDPARALSILRRLKALGVKIVMDDFGIGFASLSSLQSFPFDKIKIDRSFVAGVESNGQSAAIVRAIISLGTALSMPVLAEGVETKEQRAFLISEGCQEMQGYLIGRPALVETFGQITNGVAGASTPSEVRKIRVRNPEQRAARGPKVSRSRQ